MTGDPISDPRLFQPPTYAGVTLHALQRFGSRQAFVEEGRTLSYDGALDLLSRVVSVLAALGVDASNGVGVLSQNRAEVCIAQIAPGFLGSRFTALHPLGSFDDHLYMCDEATLKVLIVEPDLTNRAEALRAASPAVEHVLTLGPAEVGDDLLVAASRAVPATLEPANVDPESTAWLLYTGGTTGKPKAVMQSQRAVGHMALTVPVAWDIPRAPRYLACAPISHAAGLLVTPTLLSGGTVVLQRGWDPQRWISNVRQERATVGFVVPAMIYSLLEHVGGAEIASMETIMYGGAAIAPPRLAEAIDRFGPIFCQLYGQTECVGLATSLWRADHDARDLDSLASCGRAVPGTTVGILGDGDQTMGCGEPGEICIRGQQVMSGYYANPELSAEALAGGWLRTGDVGVRDERGVIAIVDRTKDMIVTGGYNVFPREVEDVLMTHPDVASAAVVGVPHPKWGEAVKAVVVLRPGSKTEQAELVALVKARKGSIQTPKSIEFVDSLPLTVVGKVDKKLLRDPIGTGANPGGDQGR